MNMISSYLYIFKISTNSNKLLDINSLFSYKSDWEEKIYSHRII